METAIMVSAIISALSTFALAIFTGYYVYYTNQLSKETKRMVDEMNMSDITFFFKKYSYPKRRQQEVFFCVKNVGKHTVRKLNIDVESTFKAHNTVIADINWVKNGINVLPPGEMHSYSIYGRTNDIYVPYDSKANIEIQYVDILNRERYAEVTLDAQEVLDGGIIYE